MNCWQILGIDADSDTASIRRAYASQLKLHRPESDPQGYQQLREAFELAKSIASTRHQEQIDADRQEMAANSPHVYSLSPVEESEITSSPCAFTPSIRPLYQPEEMGVLAFEVTENGLQGFAVLQALYDRVASEGTLMQQQQFHLDLASALAEQPGLTEWVLEKVSELLDWELDHYSSSYLIPEQLQYALYEQVRITEREQTWQKLQTEQSYGKFLDRIALTVLRSESPHTPFWVRLVPGLITSMTRQLNTLNSTFPELIQRLNPAWLEFLSTPRYALSWQGIFLLLFWGTIVHFLQPVSPLGSGLVTLIGGLIIYYLYINDLLLRVLVRKPRLAGLFFGLECLCSLLILIILFASVLFIVVCHTPSKGEGFAGMIPLFVVLIEWMVVWSVWPKHVPGIRRPGIAVARLLSSPWRLLKTLDFVTMAFPLAAAYGVFCYLLLNELIKLPG